MSELNFVLKNARAMFSGNLTLATINRSFEKKSVKILNHDAITLDLSKVKKVDTAALAWLLIMVEQAQLKNCQLTFEFLPEDLVKLAKLSAVDTFLPIK